MQTHEVAVVSKDEGQFQEYGPEDAALGLRSWNPSRSTIALLVLAAFAVRIILMFALRTYKFDRVDDSCGIGEVTRIAASIAQGHGFSSPFFAEYTGPTAWIAPVYPYFIALVFRCFGTFSSSATIFIFVVQAIFSALTIIPMLRIAGRTVGRLSGLVAAWIWILFPWFSKWSITWLWEISLSTLLFSLLFWHALRIDEEVLSKKIWLSFGALWGFALLVNPALATLYVGSLGWLAYRHRYLPRRDWLKPALLSIATCVLVISPWLVRNRVVFGQWVFLRSNFGVEFSLGNYHTSFGRGWGGKHPTLNRREYTEYKTEGELAYVKAKQKLSLEFVAKYPSEFLALTAKRVVYFWDGSQIGYQPVSWYWVPSSFGVISFLLLPALLIAHRQQVYAWGLFSLAFLLYPLPYYITFSQVRYRHVLEPLMVLLLAHAGVELTRKIGSLVQRVRSARSRGQHDVAAIIRNHRMSL
jgi:4-amino-4-deoxy-L-arabinose transferase-like glycosyltransferase